MFPRMVIVSIKIMGLLGFLGIVQLEDRKGLEWQRKD